MSTNSSSLSRRIFRLALAALTVATIGTLVWLYLEFGDALVGKIVATDQAQILSTLDLSKLERQEALMQERLKKPYLPPTRNPFSAPQPPPEPTLMP